MPVSIQWNLTMKDAKPAVPHLTTALTGPLLQLEQQLLARRADIECWFRRQWRQTPAPFYASVDLRNAGFKLAPVDTNLFPAGFNNLNTAFLPLCVQALNAAIEKMPDPVSRILIVPESHTRNMFYLESLAALQTILEQAGLQVRLGSLNAEITTATRIQLESGREVCLEPLQRHGRRLGVDDYDPDLVLLNNDLSGGLPEIFRDVEQVILPPPAMGWAQRLKSVHFAHYRDVADEFAGVLDIDPWLVQPLFRNCGEVDFMHGEGAVCLHVNVEALLNGIAEKYAEYGIEQQPFVFIKADAGTYGMGVMSVYSADELLELNRKQRTRMSKAKEGVKISNVIIQEGVYTSETWGEPGHVAEPVVYLIDNKVVGGFYRVHTKRGVNENLNAPGMRFEPLAFAECCNTPDPSLDPDAHPNRFYAYGVIARLASLAAAREMAEV